MEMFVRTLLLLACFIFAHGVPVNNENSTTPSAYKDLDSANLETLNRETRKVLLKLIGDQLATARAMMNSIQPEVKKCQDKVDERYAECLRCVDMKCQNRYKECNGSIEIIAPGGGGVSVSSSVNERGKPTTSICTVMLGQSQSCTTIMNPDGAFATSITSMGDKLHVHLQNVVNDLGGNVGMFVGQMQNVVGDINTTQAVNEELEHMLSDLNAGLSGMQLQLQTMMQGINLDLQNTLGNLGQTVSQVSQNVAGVHENTATIPNDLEYVRQMVSDINLASLHIPTENPAPSNGANNGVLNVDSNIQQDIFQSEPIFQQSVSRTGPNGNSFIVQSARGLSGINPSVNRYVGNVNRGVGGMMGNLNRGLRRWGQNFGRSMNNLFANLFGRKKRQATIIADPSHQVRCENMFKNSTVCAEYRSKCHSCPQTSNVTEQDVITQVCGDVIVDEVMQIHDKLTELTQIEDAVVSSRKIIDKIEIDKASWNADSFAFDKVFVTTDIRGKMERFSSKTPLNLLELRKTGHSIAKQIWAYWNDPTVKKPIAAV